MALSIFTTERDRDAWAAIRGFVFQVILTIDRWLKINENERLELERGEDIDTISRALGALGDEEQARLLEQIKHRESSVTLRSTSVIEFLAAAVEHRAKNPGLALRFRFLTTATPGIEKPTPFSPRRSALLHWLDAVGSGQLNTAVVENILQLLRQAPRPQELAETTWAGFQNLISSASPQSFFEFMQRVEWTFDAGDVSAVSASIRAKLLTDRYASSDDEAQDLYQRLFFSVFQLLSQPGLKALTKADLSAQLKRPPLAPQYQALFSRITSHLAGLEARFETIEHGLVGMNQSLEIYRAEVHRLARSQGLPTNILGGMRSLAYTAPPLVAGVVRREALVGRLNATLHTARLLVLSGQPGAGKTQLARLLIEPAQTLWVSLRQKKLDECTLLLEAAMSAAEVERKPFLVLDDLPRLSSHDLLTQHLLQLASDDPPPTTKLIATTSASLPLTLREDTPTGSLVEQQMPLFSEEEIMAMLQTSGAPSHALERGVAHLIQTATAGHPMLVRALLRYLAKYNWSLEQETIRSISRRDYVHPVHEEAQRLLRQTVESAESRDLLYRIDLVAEPIKQQHMQLVCAVAPAISAPFERLDELRGLWIQDEGVDRYLLSPLLSGLGVKNLSAEVQRAINQELGDSIAGRQSLSFFEADTAIHHFMQAQVFDRAGVLYLVALTAALKSPEQLTLLSLPRRWLTEDLPRGMSRVIQLYVRGAQIRVLDALSEDTTSALRRLDGLIDDATEEDALAVMHASLNAGPLRVGVSSPVVEKYYRKAIAFAEKAVSLFGQMLPSNFLDELYGMIWLNTSHIKDASDIDEWLTTADMIGATGRERALAYNRHGVRAESVFLLSQRLAIKEYQKNPSDRDWQAVITSQKSIEERAMSLGFNELAGFAAAARLTVVAETSKDVNQAENLALESLKRYGSMERARFAIQANLGTQLGSLGQPARGLAALKAALAIETGSFALVLRLHAMIEAARIAVLTSPDEAVRLAEDAVQLASAHRELAPTELVRALGELAILLSTSRSVHESYPIWARAVDEVLLAEEDTPSWKALFVILGHCLGYYLGVACTGKPPSEIDDNESYTEPSPGMFLRYREEASTTFDPSKKALLCAQVSMYAGAVGADEEARRWAERGVQIAEASGSSEALALLARLILPTLLVTNSFSTALIGSIDAAVTLLRERRYGAVPPSAAEELALRKDSEIMGRYEALFPSFVRIAHMERNEKAIARTAAQEIVATCNDLASRSTDPAPWRLAAAIFDAAFLRATRHEDRLKYVKEADRLQQSILRAVALFGASLANDATLEQSLYYQLLAFKYALSTLRMSSSMIRLVVQPFVRDFWWEQFTRRRFQFLAPGAVETELRNATQSSGVDGIRAVLLAVFHGLAPRLPDEAVRWLYPGAKASEP